MKNLVISMKKLLSFLILPLSVIAVSACSDDEVINPLTDEQKEQIIEDQTKEWDAVNSTDIDISVDKSEKVDPYIESIAKGFQFNVPQ